MIFGYTGRQFDDETGLQFNRARYYHPQTGRFISTDPSGFDGGDANLYRYAGNNPLTQTDPSGLFASLIGGAVASFASSTAIAFFSATSAAVDLASGWLGSSGGWGGTANDVSWATPSWNAPTADELMGNLRNSEVEFARLNERISSQWFPSAKDTRDLGLIEGRIHWLQQRLDVSIPITDLSSLGLSQRASVVGAAAAKLGDEGAVAVDTFSLGYALHDRSEHAQVEALRSGDIASQFAFGISKVGGRAGQAAVVVGGGCVATPLVVGAVGQSAAATAGTYLVYGGAGLGVAGTVVSARNAYDAYEAGNYIDTIGGAGDAALSAAGAFAGGRAIANRWNAPSSVGRQTFATGSEWYEHFASKYGAQNVDWVSGSGRTITWPSELPMPANTQMFRVPPAARSSTFTTQLESVAGPRPPGAIGHHNQPLSLNGVDNGLTNGSWQFNPAHQNGHNQISRIVNPLRYGTEIRIKPGGG